MQENRFMRKVLSCGLVGLCTMAGSVFAEGSKDAATPAGKIKLTYLSNINVDTEGQDVNKNAYIDYIKEKNNIDIEIINEPVSANYPTKVATIMASGDLPDYMMLPGNKEMLGRWAKEGMLAPLDSYIKDTKYLSKDFEPISWDFSKVDGKIYAIPLQRFDKTPYLTFVRKDWLKNLGIDPESIKTVDDWYRMLKRFVTDDPDKNGKDDTFGIASRDSAIPGPGTEMFLDAFNGAESRFIDGEVRPFYLQQGYKDWLKFMAKLYREKILDPEYVTTKDQQMWEKAKSGKYGMFYWFWTVQEYKSIGGSRDDLVAMKPPLKADGSQSRYLYSAPVRTFIVVSAKSKHVDKVVQLMDWALSEEGGTYVHAGLPGLDYDIKDGKIVIKPERRGKNWAWRYITLGIQKVKMDSQLQQLLSQSWGEDGLAHLRMSNEYGMYDNIKLAAPYFSELSKYDLDTYERVFRNKVIMGQVDADAEWDNFVAGWRKAGGNEWIKSHTDWYKKTYNK